MGNSRPWCKAPEVPGGLPWLAGITCPFLPGLQPIDRAFTPAKHPVVKTKTLVGWSEYVDLPKWGVSGLKAKIDTGARTSALHVEDIEPVRGGRVRFVVVVHKEKRDRHVRVEARVVRRSRVRSSSGHYESRYFVATTLRLGGVERKIEVSLVDREKMRFRMLIGRTALAGAFVVDPSKRRSPRKRTKAAQQVHRRP